MYNNYRSVTVSWYIRLYLQSLLSLFSSVYASFEIVISLCILGITRVH